jgi:hypothetical protein
MPIQYMIPCTATLTANASAFTEFVASCTEDPARGAETMIQRVYPIKIITVYFPSAPSPDVTVKLYKEDVTGIIRPLVESLPASILTKLVTVSGQLPYAFSKAGQPAIVLVNPMEKLIVKVVNQSAVGSSAVTVSFTLIAEKGI